VEEVEERETTPAAAEANGAASGKRKRRRRRRGGAGRANGAEAHPSDGEAAADLTGTAIDADDDHDEADARVATDEEMAASPEAAPEAPLDPAPEAAAEPAPAAAAERPKSRRRTRTTDKPAKAAATEATPDAPART